MTYETEKIVNDYFKNKGEIKSKLKRWDIIDFFEQHNSKDIFIISSWLLAILPFITIFDLIVFNIDSLKISCME